LAALLAPSAGAAERNLLRWEDVAGAIEQHPVIGAAASAVAAAEGALALTEAYPNPELGMRLGNGEAIDGDERCRIWGLELTVPIPSPWVYRSDVAVAAAERDAVQFEAADRRLEVVVQLKSLFWRIAHGQQRLVALAESRAQLERLVEIAQLRVAQGEARPMEAARLAIKLEQLDLEIRDVARSHALQRQTLNIWLGSRLPDDFVVQADLAGAFVLPTLAVAVERAASRHPQLMAVARRVQASAQRRRSEQGRRFPELSLTGFYERELDARSYGGALELTLPLWNWNSGGISQARAREREAGYSYELALRELEAAVREAHGEVTLALQKAESYRDVTLPKATETAAALERMYQVGEVAVLDVLDARRDVIEIESALLETYLDSQLAFLVLTTLMGGDGDD
jgi:outer membrane protein TolC